MPEREGDSTGPRRVRATARKLSRALSRNAGNESAATPVRMRDYGIFAATRTRRLPREYVIAASPNGIHEAVARKLTEHGIRIEPLAAARRVQVEQFVIENVRQTERAFQGHRETSVTGRFEQRQVDLPPGSIVVRTDQPLGRLAFSLLEPESDDGLTTWNVLDTSLNVGAPHPVLKVVDGERLETRPAP